ncbi:hypothetical protein [Fimbriimonas ginsengisoli]|uniref:Uncharacterized protein n=1 Tax=Fimbriimonas ginsengisoli Gsoil 348 TaxID=661478 RepID=A0A068NJG6_FIMGI|nr:hypothetical protein [Fimbriimonas ginsengisoli]AIE83572.1 hypothetical protein OP10G_0204 [Fimbriimonas ginsengisoli Gsoil 348]
MPLRAHPLRPAVLIGLILVSTVASAADPIRVFQFPDGRIRLWLKGAPTVTASPQGGWTIQPAGKEKDRTWLARLKTLVGKGVESPWKTTLDAVQAGSPLGGVVLLKPSASLETKVLDPKNTRLRAYDPTGRESSATFTNGTSGWTSSDAPGVESFLEQRLSATGPQVGAALLQKVGAPSGSANPLSDFVSAVSTSAVQPGPILIEGAKGPVVLDITPPALAAPAPTTGGSSGKPATPTTVAEPKEGTGFPWLPVLLSLLVGGGAGFAVRAAVAPKKKPAAPVDDSKRVAADLSARLAKRDEEILMLKQALEETKRSSKEYRDQHNAWVRDRDETVKSIEDERAAHHKARADADALAAKLKQAQDEHQRVGRELTQQVDSLTRSGQRSGAELQALTARARAYADLQREAAEAFNYIQSEVGRPEISAAVGYLLSFSCAELLESVAKPNPILARAMLTNIERIASSFGSTPHARKLTATVQRLLADLGEGTILESTQPHAHARYYDELLRLLRHQRGLELSPFYFGTDSAGAAHAVHV